MRKMNGRGAAPLNRRALLKGMGVAATTVLAAPALADRYPSQVIRFIAPYPPGGATDIFARFLAEKVKAALNQTVIVENRPGSGGLIGTRYVAKSSPDGYTLVGESFNFLTFPAMFKDPGFDIITDFAPISLIAMFPMVLVTATKVQATSVAELIALSKKGPLTFGASSTGGGGHIGGELLNQRAALRNIHVPYKGAAPMHIDLMSGAIDYGFAHITSIMEQVKSGTVRALAITSPKRSPLLPNVQTMAEQGMSDFECGETNGALFPAKTPTDIVNLMNRTMVESLKVPEFRLRLESQGAEIVGSSPEEFAKFIDTNSARWQQVAKDAGIKPT